MLEALSGLVIIDEVQRRPTLLELLRVLVDRPHNPARFLLLGSASPQLVRGVSESLAGRIGFVDLSGFDLREGVIQRDRLWLRGGFPRSFLAADDDISMAWRQDFIRTFLERDIPQLGITIPAEKSQRRGVVERVALTEVARSPGRTSAGGYARSPAPADQRQIQDGEELQAWASAGTAAGSAGTYWYVGSSRWRRRIGMISFHAAISPFGVGGSSCLISSCSLARL